MQSADLIARALLGYLDHAELPSLMTYLSLHIKLHHSIFLNIARIDKTIMYLSVVSLGA